MEIPRQFNNLGSSSSRDIENLIQRDAGGKWSTAAGKMNLGNTSLEPYIGKKEAIIKVADKGYSKEREAASARAAVLNKGELLHKLNARSYNQTKKNEIRASIKNIGRFGGAA